MRAPTRASVRAAVQARRGWTWGRQVRAAETVSADVPPARVSIICEVAAIEYEAAKGKGAGVDLWRHEHARPFPILCTSARTDLGVTRSARDVPRPSGRPLFRLGRLVAVEGRNPTGELVRVSFPRGVEIHGDPSTRRLVIVRRGAARGASAPLFYATNGSPYTLTDRGIER